MKNKKILPLLMVLVIAVVSVAVFFISRPQHEELLPQTFAELPKKPKLIAVFNHASEIDDDANKPIDLFLREVYSVSFSPVDASLIASINGAGQIKLWNTNNSKKPIKSLDHPGKYPSIGFSPTGEWLASTGSGKLVLWDVASGKKVSTLETYSNQFAFSPDGNILAIPKTHITLWDIRDPDNIKDIGILPYEPPEGLHHWGARAVDFSPDGKWIAVAHNNGTVNVWDFQNQQIVKTLNTNWRDIDYLKFSPNNRFMCVGGSENLNVRTKGYIMWETPSWQRKGEVLRGHVENLAFSPDGKICVSSHDQYVSGRGGVELWSTTNGAPITSSPIGARDAAFSKDGNLLVIGEIYGGVKLWKLTPQHFDLTTTPSDIVRIIYCLAKDKDPPPNIVNKIDRAIRDVQDFYADEMERHGFGRKTFTFETDENGKAKVYLLKENQTENFDLSNDCWLAIEDDTSGVFSNFYKLIKKAGINETFQYPDSRTIRSRNIEGFTHGKLVYASVEDLKRKPLAYALRNGLGLPYIPYRPQSNLRKDFDFLMYNVMSWRKKKAKLSKCEAEWLDKSRYFNPNQPFFDKRPKIEIDISKPDASGSRIFQFTLEDEDGIHQAQLFIPIDPKMQRGGGKKLHNCQALNGKEKATITFKISNLTTGTIVLRLIDMHGNIASLRILN